MAMVTSPAADQQPQKKMVPPQDLVQPSTAKAPQKELEDDLTRTLKMRMTDPKLQATAQRLDEEPELSPTLKAGAIQEEKEAFGKIANGTSEEHHDRPQDDADDGHTNAEEGDPWKIADVCDWLEDLGFSEYIDAFRKRRIDGIRLLQLKDIDLLQMNMSPEDARELLTNIQTLKASTVPVASDAPEWIRRTLVVKEIDGQIRLFDAATGEEVFQLADDIARQLLADGTLRRSRSNVADDDEDETEFAWVGDTKGWVRRVGAGEMLYEAEWTQDDLCAWLRHVNLDVCVPVVEALGLTPRRFKQLHPDDQEELGHEHGIGNALVEAWRLFNLRVFARHAAATAATPTPSASTSAADRSSRSLPSYIDVFAQLSPWCRIDEPPDKVAASLMEAAPPNAFAIVRDPADPLQLQLMVVMPPFGLKTFLIYVEGSKLRLETTRYLCADLSELVYIFASDNDDRAWLLNLETPLEEHLNRRWFVRSMSTDAARAHLLHRRLGSFLVFPANFEDVYTLAFVSDEGVEMRNVLLRNEGYQLEGGSHQVFPTLTDLVNHYTFVRSNDLGTVLYQEPADFQATKRHEKAAWYCPDLTREEAEATLTGMPDGSFLVRHTEHIQASFVLSYIYGDQVRHRLIDQDSEGLTFFRESVRAFKSLSDLVAAYCAEHLDDLPCRLLLPMEQQQQPPMPSAHTQTASDITAPAAPLDPVYGHGSFPWLQLSPVTKSQALSTLVGKPDGAFVVRSSERAPEYLSLSYVYGDEIHHELIGILHPETDGDSGVYLLSVPDRVFETIYDLVTYYKLNAGELHCALVETDVAPAPAFVRERAAWLVLGLPRDDAVSLLEGKPPGSFLVRESQSSPSHLVLCLVGPDGVIVQEYIEMGEQGVFLEKNPDACFRSLHDLVHYYCDPRPELPCSLVLYDEPLWHASAASLSEAGTATLRKRDEERLTLESQRAASMRVRSRPELFQDNNPHFYVQHANDRTAELTAMRSERTLKWRSFTDPSSVALAQNRIQGSAARLDSRQQQQQRHHQHQRRHQKHARRHLQSDGSRTFDDNLFGDREDAVKRTCRRLGLYAGPEDRPWMCLQEPLSKVRHFLQNQGDFVVHKSASGNYGCLTMLHNGELVSRELLRRNDGVGLEGSQLSFDRLTRLIEHYVHPAQTDLPACLGPHSM